MKKKIEKKIRKKMKIYYIKIFDESSQHHLKNKKLKFYKIIIVSEKFNKINIIQQHQLIYSILKKEIPKIIYGINLFTYTIKQWKKNINKEKTEIKCKNKL